MRKNWFEGMRLLELLFSCNLQFVQLRFIFCQFERFYFGMVSGYITFI